MAAEPEPQDVDWRRLYEQQLSTSGAGVGAYWSRDGLGWFIPLDLEQAVRSDERTRWAAREQQLVEERDYYLSLLEQLHRDTHDALADRRAVLGQEEMNDAE